MLNSKCLGLAITALYACLFLQACGGDAGGSAGPTGCSMTVKGMTTNDGYINHTVPCMAAPSVTYLPSTDQGRFSVSSGVQATDEEQNYSLMGALIYYIGPPTNTITDTSANLYLGEDNVMKTASINCFGGAEYGSARGPLATGGSGAVFTNNQFVLTLSTLEPMMVGTGTSYTVHGTLHANCAKVAQPSDVTFDIVF